MQLHKTIITIFSAIILLGSCSKREESIEVTSKDFHNAVDKVVEIMVDDIFLPPVASRIFAYPNVAAYEIIVKKNADYKSLSNQLTDLTDIPKAKIEEVVNYELTALIAHLEISKTLVYSKDVLQSYSDSLYTLWATKNNKEFHASRVYALEVTKHTIAWKDADFYRETRTMPKFIIENDSPSRWRPTLPAYIDGIEPHWDKIRPFVIDSASQFKPVSPPAFSMNEDTFL